MATSRRSIPRDNVGFFLVVLVCHSETKFIFRVLQGSEYPGISKYSGLSTSTISRLPGDYTGLALKNQELQDG
jgi:hypothetical protein